MKALQTMAFLCLVQLATACLWDIDTKKLENAYKQKFPGVVEIMTGKFPRHSKEYYRWRLKDREAKLAVKESPELYDDLAVAHDKLGNPGKAISLMLEKNQKFPGLYETYANLETFYIHAGELEKGLVEINKAIAINPDAHFGREVYQKKLVEFILSKKINGKLRLPLHHWDHRDYPIGSHYSFARYILFSEKIPNRKEEIDKAIEGILGMMRFGNYDSPILLESLASLLIRKDLITGAYPLRIRAYLLASYSAKDPGLRQLYREMATSDNLKKVEASLKKEIEEADQWFQGIVDDEKRWIREGVDVDKAFAEKYLKVPTKPVLGPSNK